jgi:hypothetical protein
VRNEGRERWVTLAKGKKKKLAASWSGRRGVRREIQTADFLKKLVVMVIWRKSKRNSIREELKAHPHLE